MGYGSYSYAAHQAITSARADLPAQKVFTATTVHPLMDPMKKLRQSNDSENHPNTVPIIFALDVSGSMGAVPERIARHELPGFMKTLIDSGVADPQVLFMAFQDAAGPDGPLQVGQFESAADRIDQWLTWSWLVGGGYSQFESYDLAMYFAAHHTRIDSWDKRKKKGYFFMSGDEPCYPNLSAEWVKDLIGDELPADVPLAVVVDDLKKRFHPFFLIPDPGRAAVHPFWKTHFGEAAMVLAEPGDVCPVAAGAVALLEGAIPNLAALGASLRKHERDEDRVSRVLDAMRPWAKSIGKG